jgi:hypothetical protein
MVKEAFNDCNTVMEYILPGDTSKLQIMEVGINKPIKEYLQRELKAWMVHNPKEIHTKRQNVAW